MAGMDFRQTITALLDGFARHRIRYAAIGGFALGVLGVPRSTGDLDFLVSRDDLGSLDALMSGLGYRLTARTENVSHYAHNQAVWGTLDVLHAFRRFSVGMLDRARTAPIFDGASAITVLQPEDIIGLKVQALANDATRLAQETADIEALAARYGAQLDWDRIQEYYELFDCGSDGTKLRERFAHA